ncbi:hypothetical protein AKJ39_01810 [candidate division MSBL1 archaeon SCGC-AAA259J03]|uniref:Response regulatory domain-containing protein n=1 Tax=candidate division MSBL1 archaeon SCGC-AAA259J03 TaxID=1698269 RepID=A0A656YWW1_9EURY|nr:hypothetical protein AKJ39_01810 [candidate division MSBL1 archaeon SCGC-AAA259J03]
MTGLKMRNPKPRKDTEIKILLVDRDQKFLERTKALWESRAEWTTVETTTNPEEALEKIRNANHDAIVAGYELSGMTGLELLETIRERGGSTPFVVLTGAGSEEIASKALNLEADQYITKDIDPETQFEGIMNAIFDRPIE